SGSAALPPSSAEAPPTVLAKAIPSATSGTIPKAAKFLRMFFIVTSFISLAGSAPSFYRDFHWGNLGLAALLQNRLGDRVRQTLGRFDQADDRHDDDEEGKVVERTQLRHEDVGTFRRARTEPAEEDGVDHEQPEEQLEPRTIDSRTNLRRIEPRHDEEDGDRAEHGQNAAKLRIDRADVEGDGAQHRVEGQEVPFRNDVSRRLERIGRDIVIRMAEEVRHVEDEISEEHEEDERAESVLD